ncbi:F-box protein skip23 [Rhynchospora pubera]|uniref:F-box protein skip23 n=1 Tax=Rhynchospora pubera TaxID=906938 RepID=A0AAV8EUZ5_9POAL|nr:F-box protein skip23 [Rhynchospora pubera]
MSGGGGGEERNWSELPSELLHLIAKKLPDLVDFIRLRAVCSTWRFSAPLSDTPHQLPWLLELSDTKFSTLYTLRERQRFYSVSSHETLTISLTNKKPELHNFVSGGVYSGYLPFSDYWKGTVSFFNPLTGDSFYLPPVSHRRLLSPWMVWTGTDPIRTRSIIVVDRDLQIRNEIGEWALYDPRSNKWVENEGYFYHCCYWHEMFFSTHVHKPTQVFDAHSRELLHEIPPPDIENYYKDNNIASELRQSYLVVSSGVILRVVWRLEYCRDDKTIEESVFYIYRLDFERVNDSSCWVQIDDIGNQILFLGEMNGFSMTARPNCGFSKGCIYFIDPYTNKPYMHDISAGTVEMVPCPFERCTWFLPGL